MKALDKETESKVRERAYDDANRAQNGGRKRPICPYAEGSIEAMLWSTTFYMALSRDPDAEYVANLGLDDL